MSPLFAFKKKKGQKEIRGPMNETVSFLSCTLSIAFKN